MSNDDFTDAARAEATSRARRAVPGDSAADWSERMLMMEQFRQGAEWGRDQTLAQEPTDDETGHAYAEWMNHSPISDLNARRLNCTCGARGFTPSGYEHHRLRAALTAAHATR